MIDHHVTVIRNDGQAPVYGELRSLKPEGVIVYRTASLPEAGGNLFIPMSRITEIVDRGRAGR